MDCRSYFCVCILLALDRFLLNEVEALTVVLNSPRFNNGIAYLSKSSKTPWSLKGHSLRSCPNARSQVDDYYVLPGVSTSSAKEVVIDVTYTLHCCLHILKIGLYALNTLTLIHTPPKPMEHSYLHVTDLTTTNIIQMSRSGVFTTRSYVAVEGYPYLYIAFRTQGFCGSVDAISMHYFKCEAVSKNLVSYPETVAPRNEAKTVQISGSCMQQSFPVTTAAANTMICYSNGTSTVTGGCQCMAGYQHISDSKCSACPPKTFKSSGGNYNCRVCGANVEDGSHPRTKMCQCKAGYWKPRAYMNDFHVNCEEPPSKPGNVSVETIHSTGVSLRWSRPNRMGTGDDVWYLIRYGTKSLTSFTESIILTGLAPYTWYNVTISSRNNVTAVTGVSRTASVSFMTPEGSPDNSTLIGLSVGGVIGLALIVLVTWLFCRRKRRANKTPQTNDRRRRPKENSLRDDIELAEDQEPLRCDEQQHGDEQHGDEQHGDEQHGDEQHGDEFPQNPSRDNILNQPVEHVETSSGFPIGGAHPEFSLSSTDGAPLGRVQQESSLGAKASQG